MNAETVELHAIVTGQVQGVGFRYVTQKIAKRLGLSGTVRNLPNGTVEIYAQGKKESLEQLKKELHQYFHPSSIASFNETWVVPHRSFTDFIISK